MSYVQYAANNLSAGASTIQAGAITVGAGHALLVYAHRASNIGQPSTITDGGTGNVYTPLTSLYQTSYALTAAPTGLSATLSVAWAGGTGTNYASFSNGEVHQILFTNGLTAITWSDFSAASTSTLPVVFSGNTQIDVFLAQNCAGVSTNVAATTPAGSGQLAIVVAEYSGVVTSGAFLGMQMNQQIAAGGGANVVTSGNATVASASAVLVGLGVNYTDSNTFTAGTSPIAYTARAIPNFVGNSPNIQEALLEDAVVTSNGGYPATFTCNGYGVGSIVIALNQLPPAVAYFGNSGQYLRMPSTAQLRW